MRETAEPLFESVVTAGHCLKVATGFMRKVKFNQERMKSACESGFMNAMAAATYLARSGVPFRQAHEIVAKAGQKCLLQDLGMEQLTLQGVGGFTPGVGNHI